MKAVQLIAPKRPLELRDLPVPEPGPGEVLVKVRAAGICHSDAHYRAGISPVEPLPLTLGHEVAGTVEALVPGARLFAPGARVCGHYLATCGHCAWCDKGSEQFCVTGKMIGKHRHGGYAEYICVPERSLFRLPEEIPFEQGAVMMCSSSTALHALLKTRLKAGESVAIFGVGGLGVSAVQLANALGAGTVFAVDIKPGKLERARSLGAVPVNAAATDAVEEIKRQTRGRGVDVALELIGLPQTMRQAVQSLGIMGRAGLVGLTSRTFEVAPYTEVLNKEAEIIGVSDHLASEIPQLLDWARKGRLQFAEGTLLPVRLEAGAINQALDRLEAFSEEVRFVITP